MKKQFSLVLLFLAAILFSCDKFRGHVSCTSAPPFAISFELVDSAGRDVFDMNTPGHADVADFHITYMEQGTLKEIPLDVYRDTVSNDSVIQIAYYFGSNDFALKSGEQGIKNYYVGLNGVTDTLNLDVKYTNNGCTFQRTEAVKFKGKTAPRANFGDAYRLSWP